MLNHYLFHTGKAEIFISRLSDQIMQFKWISDKVGDESVRNIGLVDTDILAVDVRL